MKKNLFTLMFVFLLLTVGFCVSDVNASTFKVKASNRYISKTKDTNQLKISNQKAAYKKLVSRIVNACSANYVFGPCAGAIEEASRRFDAMVAACQVSGPDCDNAQQDCDRYAIYVMSVCDLYPEDVNVTRKIENLSPLDSGVLAVTKR